MSMGILFKRAVSLFTLSSFLMWNLAMAAPEGGTVVAGGANISQSGNTTTINQSTQNAIINWNGFNTTANEAVGFVQPNSSSIALNRVTSGMPTSFAGQLTANGHVWIVNPAGVLFTSTSRIDVAGLVATTLNITDQNFMAKNYKFDAVPGFENSKIINNGLINIKDSGFVALVAPMVENNGLIVANKGTVVLASGKTAVIDLYGDELISFATDTQTYKDGKVAMTSSGVDKTIKDAINMSGVIEANNIVEGKGGVLILGGGNGKTTVSGIVKSNKIIVYGNDTKISGTLKTPDGGFVETSGNTINIDPSANIDPGKGGLWYLDPADLTIDASLASVIGSKLTAGSNIIMQTSGTAGAGLGDINVTGGITWTGAAYLQLSAYHDINISAPISGASGHVVLRANNLVNGAGGTGTVNFTGAGHVTALTTDILYTPTGGYTAPTNFTPNVTGTLSAYMLVNNATDLVNVNNNLGGTYALGTDINLVSSPFGASPIGTFTGTFNGFNHTLSNVSVNTTLGTVGGLMRENDGTVSNLNLTGNVTTNNSSYYIGGIVGYNIGTLTNVSFTGNVSATNTSSSGSQGVVGGLVGMLDTGTIQESFIGTGSVISINSLLLGSNNYAVGGLAGQAQNGAIIQNSYSAGSAQRQSAGGVTYTGGIVGIINNASLINVYMLYRTSLGGINVNPLVGFNAGAYTATQSFYNSTNISAPCGDSQCGAGKIMAATDAQMKTAATFTGAGWSPSIWQLADGSYPTIAQTAAITYSTLLVGRLLDTGGGSPGPVQQTISLTINGVAQPSVLSDTTGLYAFAVPVATFQSTPNFLSEASGLINGAVVGTLGNTIANFDIWDNNVHVMGTGTVNNSAFSNASTYYTLAGSNVSTISGFGFVSTTPYSLTGNVTTDSPILFTNTLAVPGTAALTGSTITFANTVSGGGNLTINGTTNFTTGGGSMNLNNLTFNGSIVGNGIAPSLAATNTLTIGANATQNVSNINGIGLFAGQINIYENIITNTGSIFAQGPVTIGNGAVTPLVLSGTGTGVSTFQNNVLIHSPTTIAAGAQLNFQGNVDGPAALTLTMSNNAIVDLGSTGAAANIGSAVPLDSLTSSGGTFGIDGPLGGSSVVIKTVHDQTYGGLVTVFNNFNDVRFESTNNDTITFNGGLGVPDTFITRAMPVTIIGNAVFNNANVTGLSGLSVSGNTTINNVFVGMRSSFGPFSIAFNGPVTVLGIASTSATGGTSFNDVLKGPGSLTVNGAASFAGDIGTNTGAPALGSLHVTGATTFGANNTVTATTSTQFDGNVNGAGTINIVSPLSTFGGSVGNSTAFANFNISGNSVFNAANGVFTVNNTSLLTGNVTLGGNLTMSAGTQLGIGGTVSGAHNLSITAATVNLGGDIGSALTPLTSLAITGNTKLQNSTASIYANTVSFTGLVDSGSGANNLTITANNTSFSADIGGVSPLGSLVVNGVTTLAGSVANVATSGVVGAVFNGALSGNLLTITGNAGLGGATTLNALHVTGDTVILNSAAIGGPSIFDGVINGPGSLTISGNSTFGGNIGATTALQSLTVNAPVIFTPINFLIRTVGLTSFANTLTAPATNLTIDGNASFGGNITMNSLAITGTSALSAGAFSINLGSGQTVSFGGTVNGTATDLDINGNAIFGANANLRSLDISGTTLLNGSDINTSGNQQYSGTITLGNEGVLNSTGGSINFPAGINGGSQTLTISSASGITGGNVIVQSLFLGGSGGSDISPISKGSVVAGVGGYFTILATRLLPGATGAYYINGQRIGSDYFPGDPLHYFPLIPSMSTGDFGWDNSLIFVQYVLPEGTLECPIGAFAKVVDKYGHVRTLLAGEKKHADEKAIGCNDNADA